MYVGGFPNQFLYILSVQNLSLLILKFREIVRKLRNFKFQTSTQKFECLLEKNIVHVLRQHLLCCLELTDGGEAPFFPNILPFTTGVSKQLY